MVKRNGIENAKENARAKVKTKGVDSIVLGNNSFFDFLFTEGTLSPCYKKNFDNELRIFSLVKIWVQNEVKYQNTIIYIIL